MNTQKRMQALQRAAAARRGGASAVRVRPTAAWGLAPAAVAEDGQARLANPACVPGNGRDCEHALVDKSLNALLHRYEQTVRGRFESIEDVLRNLSTHQHDRDFAERAQAMARQRLDLEWPQDVLDRAWVAGVDMAQLYAHALFETVSRCVDLSPLDQAPWRNALPVQAAVWRGLGFHTLDISPCADGRLQGVLPFVLRTAPDDGVMVKAYAGALFDVETDVADWCQRQVEQAQAVASGMRYLKVAVYHFSSSDAQHQGCAAHGSHDDKAIAAAIERLSAFRQAVTNLFGAAQAPEVMLLGMDTDLDAIRVHLPDRNGHFYADRFLCAASLYRDTVGMEAERARATIARAVQAHVRDIGGLPPASLAQGLTDLAQAWLVANLSQIEYVITHHRGRYAVVGHDEWFVCAGETVDELQLRNQFYFAHLDTVEEGAADLDVGKKIFTALNLCRGLPVPVLVHFEYDSRVPGSRERAVARGLRVQQAVCERYAALQEKGMLVCRVAVSDRHGGERLAFVAQDRDCAGAH